MSQKSPSIKRIVSEATVIKYGKYLVGQLVLVSWARGVEEMGLVGAIYHGIGKRSWFCVWMKTENTPTILVEASNMTKIQKLSWMGGQL